MNDIEIVYKRNHARNLGLVVGILLEIAAYTLAQAHRFAYIYDCARNVPHYIYAGLFWERTGLFSEL